MNASDRAQIRKAVIPAAGQGTRLRPLTSIIPKEMLPLGPKPAVEYIIEELHSVGVDDIIFVISPLKSRIEEFFGESACGGEVRFRYVIQDPQKGLADAVLQAEDAVGGEHFIVALGDTVIFSRRRPVPLARLVEAYRTNPATAAMLVERVPIETAPMYGMVKPAPGVMAKDKAFEIAGMVEKPGIEEAPSEYAIGGRYIFGPGIFDWIRRTPTGVGGEVQITDSVRLALAEGERVWCVPLLPDERRYDIGDPKVYCEAFAAACMLDPELAQSMSRAVKGMAE